MINTRARWAVATSPLYLMLWLYNCDDRNGHIILIFSIFLKGLKYQALCPLLWIGVISSINDLILTQRLIKAISAEDKGSSGQQSGFPGRNLLKLQDSNEAADRIPSRVFICKSFIYLTFFHRRIKCVSVEVVFV